MSDEPRKNWQQYLNEEAGITVWCMEVPILEVALHDEGKPLEDYAKLLSDLDGVNERVSDGFDKEVNRTRTRRTRTPEEIDQRLKAIRENPTVTITPDEAQHFLSAPKIIDRAIEALTNSEEEHKLEDILATRNAIEKFNESILQPALAQRRERV